MPDFVPGIVAYTLWGMRPRLPSWLWLPVILCLTGFHCMLRIFSPGIHEWPLCLVIGFAIPLFRQVRQAHIIAAAHYIAKYSYGIYLTHLFSLWLAFHVYQGPLTVQIILWLSTLMVFPVVAYHLIEEPGIGVGVRLTNRLMSRATSLALSVPGSHSSLHRSVEPVSE
jgi:peptidoglycan/LPS O-acetylase OafA/YrhL